jgi:hypothetical protein
VLHHVARRALRLRQSAPAERNDARCASLSVLVDPATNVTLVSNTYDVTGRR